MGVEPGVQRLHPTRGEDETQARHQRARGDHKPAHSWGGENSGLWAQSRLSPPPFKAAALPLQSLLTPPSTLGLTCLDWKAGELHFRQSPFTPLGV